MTTNQATSAAALIYLIHENKWVAVNGFFLSQLNSEEIQTPFSEAELLIRLLYPSVDIIESKEYPNCNVWTFTDMSKVLYNRVTEEVWLLHNGAPTTVIVN